MCGLLFQDATKLEMGRTYEMVDSGEVARQRGAAATQREKDLAASLGNPRSTARKQGLRALVTKVFRR